MSTPANLADNGNRDLVWDLDGFQHRRLAAEFVKRFENKLCVYSSTVEQLYTNYSIFFPEDEDRKMVILPDPYAYHDTFQNIPAAAVKGTGLNILPGEMLDKAGLFLAIPFRGESSARYKPVPLQVGLNAINRRRSPDNPFLPGVGTGDLREFQRRSPVLHLHCIQLDRLVTQSSMERSGIRRVISEKLPTIC